MKKFMMYYLMMFVAKDVIAKLTQRNTPAKMIMRFKTSTL